MRHFANYWSRITRFLDLITKTRSFWEGENFLHFPVRDTTWLSAAMCHLCKCHSEKIEIWYTLLILKALDLVLNHNAKEKEASYTDHLNVIEKKYITLITADRKADFMPK